MYNPFISDMCRLQMYTRLADINEECKAMAYDKVEQFAQKYNITSAAARLIAMCDPEEVSKFLEGRMKDQYKYAFVKYGTVIKKIRGELTFTATELDVTDPCYETGVWCRIKVPIVPGVYNYEAQIAYTDWGCRVKALRIMQKNAGFSRLTYGKYIDGEVGVDAGLAGFFENKPDYDKTRDSDDREWSKICHHIDEAGLAKDVGPGVTDVVEAHKDNPFGCEGICTSSGYGDGGYYVRQLLNKEKQVCGYELRFL